MPSFLNTQGGCPSRRPWGTLSEHCHHRECHPGPSCFSMQPQWCARGTPPTRWCSFWSSNF
jgi:hypothetical protein